jgi:hypothetical protein
MPAGFEPALVLATQTPKPIPWSYIAGAAACGLFSLVIGEIMQPPRDVEPARVPVDTRHFPCRRTLSLRLT